MEKTCFIETCKSPPDRKGLCTAHYMRARRNNGNPLGGRTPVGKPLEFLNKAIKSRSDDCIIWPYNSSGATGYGQIIFKSKPTTAHRAALILATGITPKRNVHAAHDPECTSRLCVNPNHLRWASAKENEADKPDGWQSGPNNGRAKLTEDQVRFIRTSELGCSRLAKALNVGETVILNVRPGRTYKSIK